MYLISSSSSLMNQPDNIGVIVGPRVGGIRPLAEGRKWAGDNDAFHGRFTEVKFLGHLRRLAPHRENCLFVAAPDVVGDADATLDLFDRWASRIRGLGFPVAWVAQNGATEVPNCDVVFIGGCTEWKLGTDAMHICIQAKARGLWVHVGRVNSQRRAVMAAQMGADSVDGTYVSFRGLEWGLSDITGWLNAARSAAPLRRLL